MLIPSFDKALPCNVQIKIPEGPDIGTNIVQYINPY